ncbi:methionine aminopeptidase [Pseudoclavibacter endophyticus]|uniref:Methionine aminopeptidase n=1 Tax=Pseudoclavibacter endophyticus TaxID=1778590 RepID=A0A6H9WTI9_9MICO|nr:type I methionyl aminopeptidase [Pseudoclavibacter endophyticus]KAB1650005.1 type I methionyl aminopeptidase [Pseudoclavibacter endophyticus]GGA58036.1 methionine aminopeptidase [Pseudoclavibacter endophyticus]
MPKNPSTGLLTPGTVTPQRPVPASIARPHYVGRPAPEPWSGGDVYAEDDIERIGRAGSIAAAALAHLEQFVAPGVTTDELDAIAHDFLVERGAYPSCLGYRGFPKAICTSLNEVVCHGIPDDTVLDDGDILNVDCTAFVDGVHGDTNRMYLVGEVDDESRLLVERTREALRRGIKAVKPGREVNVIGRVIEKYAKRFGYGVVRDYTGHGVGKPFHSGLVIPHYDSDQQRDTIEVGMVFTIEPMLTIGGGHEWTLWDDDWTVVTADGSRTAQWEHTIVVREHGAEVLTLASGDDWGL